MVENSGGNGRHYFYNGAKIPGPSPQTLKCEIENTKSAIKAAVDQAGGKCLRLFIAGSVTHIGKTTVCLSILAVLKESGFSADDLAYIKPATQCETPDLLQHWCEQEGVAYVSGQDAPLVFYNGFTRSFLNGEQGSSVQWLDRIRDKVDQLSASRRVVIIDGVGYPAVGSVVGVDNADVALATQAPVLIVCKSGVGDAIDSYSLNSAYFMSKGIPVQGAIFNLAGTEGFYSSDKCLDAISKWFAKKPGCRQTCYGVVPVSSELQGLRERVCSTSKDVLSNYARLNAAHFAQHVDLPSILRDAALDVWCRGQIPAPKRPSAESAADQPFQPKSRLEVSAEAKSRGARGGG